MSALLVGVVLGKPCSVLHAAAAAVVVANGGLLAGRPMTCTCNSSNQAADRLHLCDFGRSLSVGALLRCNEWRTAIATQDFLGIRNRGNRFVEYTHLTDRR